MTDSTYFACGLAVPLVEGPNLQNPVVHLMAWAMMYFVQKVLHQRPSTKPDTIIIGAGPIGLLTAIESILSGRSSKVLLLEKRSTFNRDQVFGINQQFKNRIEFLVGKNFFQRCLRNGIIIERKPWEHLGDTSPYWELRVQHMQYILFLLAHHSYKDNDKILYRQKHFLPWCRSL